MAKKQTRFNPFPNVNSQYGAPMGRHSYAPRNFVDATRLYAQHQGGRDGYDRGGAYWGFPVNVWAVWTRGGESVCYVRAWSRDDAIAQARGL